MGRNEVERLVSQILLSECLLLPKVNVRSAVDTSQGQSMLIIKIFESQSRLW